MCDLEPITQESHSGSCIVGFILSYACMLVHEMQLFINIIIENRVWEFSRQPRNPLAMAMVTRCSKKKKKKKSEKGEGLGEEVLLC